MTSAVSGVKGVLARTGSGPASTRMEGLVVIGALAAATGGAWVYLVFGFHSVPGVQMGGSADMSMKMSMGTLHAWTVGDFVVTLLMWAVMMVAMMLPSAVPLTLVYAAVNRKAGRLGTPISPVLSLVAGYLSLWMASSVALTAAQWGLGRLSLLSSSMAIDDARLGALVVTAAGIYELTPLKRVCLDRCRDPARTIAAHWHSGRAGGLRTGVHLGVYCLGCCWVLMALLFVGGVMNLVWVAAIGTFVLLEKIAPMATVWSRVVGAAMIAGGAVGAVVLA